MSLDYKLRHIIIKKLIGLVYIAIIGLSKSACVVVINEGDTPFLVRSIQGVFRRYAVRKGSVRSTQKSCYIVRSYLFLLLKGPIYIKKHNKRDVQSQIIQNFSRARYARAFLGVISAFINLNNDFARSKTRK